MPSHHPTYTNLDYKHVPQEWCDAICFESCCIKTASQDANCVQANREGCCFAIKRPYTEAPS